MSEITLNIDGREVQGHEGQTILDVCKANDISVPTLCHHPKLSNVGACRMCVVEIEGDRKLNTACTTPARNGMVVRTDTEDLRALRLMTLELLFSERNHVCPICPMSSNCELQDIGYTHGMTYVRYPYMYPNLPMDNSHRYFGMDHNRCILCSRCIRVCDEVIGIHTLDFVNRGGKVYIGADNDVPYGESSCISCGSCVEVCPTGALFEKRSAHWRRHGAGEYTRTVCHACSLGCGMIVESRDNSLVRILGDWDDSQSGGRLCVKGRYRLVEEPYPRVTVPLVRDNGGFREASWEEAFAGIRSAVESARQSQRPVGGLAASRLPLETLAGFQSWFTTVLGSDHVSALDAADIQTLQATNGTGSLLASSMSSVQTADSYLIIGADLPRTHPVLASYMWLNVHKHQARLVTINSRPHDFASLSDVWIKTRRGATELALIGLLKSVAKIKECEVSDEFKAVAFEYIEQSTTVPESAFLKATKYLVKADAPAILVGTGLMRHHQPKLLRLVHQIAQILEVPKEQVIHLLDSANSAVITAAKLDQNGWFQASTDLTIYPLIYLLLGDETATGDEGVSESLLDAPYVVAQSTYLSPLAEIAQVVLPSRNWCEQYGTFVNLQGRAHSTHALLTPPSAVPGDLDILANLAGVLGQAWDTNAGQHLIASFVDSADRSQACDVSEVIAKCCVGMQK